MQQVRCFPAATAVGAAAVRLPGSAGASKAPKAPKASLAGAVYRPLWRNAERRGDGGGGISRRAGYGWHMLLPPVRNPLEEASQAASQPADRAAHRRGSTPSLPSAFLGWRWPGAGSVQGQALARLHSSLTSCARHQLC
jgi:hypothetical protein